jgi:hypothetical protein
MGKAPGSRRVGLLGVCGTGANRIQLVLFGMQNRMSGPSLDGHVRLGARAPVPPVWMGRFARACVRACRSRLCTPAALMAAAHSCLRLLCSCLLLTFVYEFPSPLMHIVVRILRLHIGSDFSMHASLTAAARTCIKRKP